MSRLTFTDEEMERIDTDCPVKNDYHIDRFCDNVCDEFQHNCPFMKMAQKLKAYEDKEEQGLLISVPCKIGDIIYEPTNRNTINEYRVTGIKKEAFAIWIEWKLEKGFVYQSIYGVEVGDIGKTVFLTRSEAEEALARMKGE